MLVNGSTVSLGGNSALALAGGEIRMLGAQDFEVTYDTGEAVEVSYAGSYLNVQVNLPSQYPTDTLTGLLGANDPKKVNDLLLPDGSVLSGQVSAATLYGEYANDWRLTNTDTLFD